MKGPKKSTTEVAHLKVENASHEVQGFSVEAAILPNLAFQHMSGAIHFSDRIKYIEEKNIDKEYGAFFDEIIYSFVACITLATASMETFLNEAMVFLDMNDTLQELLQRQGNVLARYGYFISLQGGKKLDTSDEIYKNAEILRQFRNDLCHYKPEWSNKRKKHVSLEDKLPKLQRSLFISEGNTLFPLGCMSYPYSRWAVKSSYDFIYQIFDFVDFDRSCKALWTDLGTRI